jgi:anti-sigma-K factor RskA
MKAVGNMEKLIKKFCLKQKLCVTTSAEMDKKILDDALAALEKSKEGKPAAIGPNFWRTTAKSRMVKLIAAAMIIVAISLFIAYQDSRKLEPAQVVSVSKSPAEMLTVASLNMAYRRGGIKAVERQCDEAIEKLGLRQRKLTVKELLTEFNGT